MKIFLISPVRNSETTDPRKRAAYVASLERSGHQVHWPIRDTEQDDPTGGYEICRANFTAILEADEIHVWYDESSHGSKFDMGGVFMLTEMLGRKRKIVIANDCEVKDTSAKSFFKVLKRLEQNTK